MLNHNRPQKITQTHYLALYLYVYVRREKIICIPPTLLNLSNSQNKLKWRMTWPYLIGLYNRLISPREVGKWTSIMRYYISDEMVSYAKHLYVFRHIQSKNDVTHEVYCG